MEIKIAGLITSSVFAATAFIGCSCARSVDNDADNLNKIAIESDVTVSSEISTDTAYTETSVSTETGTGTETSTASGTQTSKSVQVQYVGNPNSRVTTAKPAATQVVIVTVTIPPQTSVKTTEAAAAVTNTVATQNVPDGIFTPATDMVFTLNDIKLQPGEEQHYLELYARNVSDGTIMHGGTAAHVYTFDGFHVATEYMTGSDGAAGEFITEIVLTGDDVGTNKGVKIGSAIDEIYAAYGISQCINEEPNIYKYKTDDGYVLEFTTDGGIVTEIKYYMAVE